MNGYIFKNYLLKLKWSFDFYLKFSNFLQILGRGGPRGGRGGGGFKGGKTVSIEPHRHEGVFVARGKEDALVTLNLVPGSEVYGEKRISVEVNFAFCCF